MPGPLRRKPPPPLRERAIETLRLLKHGPRTFGLVWESARKPALMLLLCLVVGALLPPAMAWVGKQIVDAVSLSARTGLAADRETVLRFVGIELGLVLLQMVVGRLQALLRQLTGAELGHHVNTRILRKALALDVEHFEDSEIHDQLQNARREASSRPLDMTLELATLGTEALTLASFGVLLWHLAWWALPAIALASLPAFIVEARFSGDAFRLSSWRAPEGRRQNYLEWVLTRDVHAKEVKVYGLGPLLLGRYEALFHKFFGEDRALALRRFASGVLLGLVSLAAFYGGYLAMASRAAGAEISLGDLTLFLAAFRQGQQTFQRILGSVNGLYSHGLFMGNLFAFLDLPTREERPAGTPKPLPSGPPQLVFEDVGFRYPRSDVWAVRHLNLTIGAGEKLALVGENGAGKSTLIKLLMRLHRPTEGRILWNGVDLAEVDAAELRPRIGAVFQDFVRYQFSLAENVGLGWVPAMEERPRIERAIDDAGARAVVEKLPNGLDAMLGGWFEQGQELSGGQWQKVAIARAFMREGDLLILDEPTAALDAEAEHDLFQRLERLAASKTALLISHRFSTVRRADRIAVLVGGAIEELGSHAELLAKDGRYARLYRLQAEGYAEVPAPSPSPTPTTPTEQR